MASGENRKQWHEYLPIASLNYNTTYHSRIDCELSPVFHGRVPRKNLDHKLGLGFNPTTAPTRDFAEELLRRTKILHEKTKKNVMQFYIKYKRYYDKKAKASPLTEKGYCFTLQPENNHQASKIPFRDLLWIVHYLVEKILLNKKNILLKLKTNKTQIPHRIRPESTILKNLLKTFIRKLNGRLTIIFLFRKMIYTPLHGKWNLEDTYLTFPS